MLCTRCGADNQHGGDECFICNSPLSDGDTQQTAATEAVAGIRPAGFLVRTVAFVIDLVFLTGVALFAFTVIPFINTDLLFFTSESLANPEAAALNAFWAEIVSLLITLAYYTYAVSLLATTVGKWVMGLRVVRTDGRKLGSMRAMLRYWAFSLSLLLLGLGCLIAAFRKDKRGLHDILCDTMVVYRNSSGVKQPSQAPAE